MRLLKIIALGLGSLLLVVALVLSKIVGPRIDADMNAVLPHEPWQVSAEAKMLHDTLLVADLHADTLLWARNPAKLYDYGHTDMPRFREGGMFLQVFTAVTKSPPDLNYDHNEAASGDDITLLAIGQFWPISTWGSLYERAAFQARRLEKLTARDDAFWMIRSREDLEMALEARKANPNVVAGIMGMEGAHPFEGKIENLARLYDAGHRVIGLQHFFDNELGGSLHGDSCEGLTAFGAEVVAEADRRAMILDVAHSCEKVAWDVLALTDRPLIVSHTGIRSKCDTARNVSDELLAEIARRGGLIGIGFWDDAICDATPDGIAAMILHGTQRFGIEAIALGTDFDGTVVTYLDVSEMAAITDALIRAGMSDADIRKVMGENQIRFFLEQLPRE